MELRPYQKEAKEAVFEQWGNGTMKRTFAVLGGDMRQLRLAQLLEQDGQIVYRCGFDQAPRQSSLEQAVTAAVADYYKNKGIPCDSCLCEHCASGGCGCGEEEHDQ